MTEFFTYFAPIVGGALGAFVGGTAAHAVCKKLGEELDINRTPYGPAVVLTAIITAIVSGVCNYHLLDACGVGCSVVSLILTAPALIALSVAVIHGPYVVTTAGGKLADLILSLINSGDTKKS